MRRCRCSFSICKTIRPSSTTSPHSTQTSSSGSKRRSMTWIGSRASTRSNPPREKSRPLPNDHPMKSKLLLIALLACALSAHAAKQPNIIFILADDLGWTDLAVQGSKYYETPNIDRLAAQGTRLTRYHNCQ